MYLAKHTKFRYLSIESDTSTYHYVECLNLPSIEGIGLFQKTLSLENSWGADRHPVTPSPKFYHFLNQAAHSAWPLKVVNLRKEFSVQMGVRDT